ncbi:unnamed protein product [Arabidopsis arenosa]|uniref:RRM domain-containing protein n=1 Tax=Arabidopsis arenosa TaxID=38785 RepID=A0A8S2APF1_ARAAE|nr:unnamed protein product [Arabidopsis arenosa]
MDMGMFSQPPPVYGALQGLNFFASNPEMKAFFEKPIRSWVIDVEGFDTSLPADEMEEALINHFKSCGAILRASVRRHPDNGLATIVMVGDDADEKVMQLNGTELGGKTLVVKARPLRLLLEDLIAQIQILLLLLRLSVRGMPHYLCFNYCNSNMPIRGASADNISPTPSRVVALSSSLFPLLLLRSLCSFLPLGQIPRIVAPFPLFSTQGFRCSVSGLSS